MIYEFKPELNILLINIQKEGSDTQTDDIVHESTAEQITSAIVLQMEEEEDYGHKYTQKNVQDNDNHINAQMTLFMNSLDQHCHCSADRRFS